MHAALNSIKMHRIKNFKIKSRSLKSISTLGFLNSWDLPFGGY
jgi:hypothetical protein